MQNNTQKFRWGAMSWTILALGGLAAVVYMFGGFDVSSALVATQQ